jgi:hypothetical protein
MKFMHFMMALRADFEPTWASLQHCTPLPKLNATIAELIYEETRHSTMQMQSPDLVIAAAPHSAPKFLLIHISIVFQEDNLQLLQKAWPLCF